MLVIFVGRAQIFAGKAQIFPGKAKFAKTALPANFWVLAREYP